MYTSHTGAVFLLLLASRSSGATLSVARHVDPFATRFSTSLTRAPKGIPMTDSLDALYFVNITLGGQDFMVQLDTGSSDLWILNSGDPINFTNVTNISSQENYAVGVASGNIAFAELQLGSYHVPSQAFLNITQAAAVDGIFNNGASGILGMGFSNTDASPIVDKLQAAYGENYTLGQAAISNIFAQNPGSPNCFDINLERTDDINDYPGIFLIGEHAEGYEKVASQPKLNKEIPDRWTIALDEMSVNGKPFKFGPSSISGLAPGKVGAVLDTGFSFPPIPRAALDAIYSGIPGAVDVTNLSPLNGSGLGTWSIPCTSAVNLTFTFGGVQYPMHPLDITHLVPVSLPLGPHGEVVDVTLCLSSFTPLRPEGFVGIDLILGDPFLRSVYASFNMGDADGSSNGSFIQLLSTVDAEDAWVDFLKTRDELLRNNPHEVDPAKLQKLVEGSRPADNSTYNTHGSAVTGNLETSSGSSSTSDDKLTSLVEKYGPVVLGLLGGNLAIGLMLCIIALVACLRSRSGMKGRSVNPTYAPVRFKEPMSTLDGESYQD